MTCRLYGTLNQYEPEHFNRLISRVRLPLGRTPITSRNSLSDWEITTETRPVPDRGGTVDFEIQFRCVAGKLKSAAVAVEFEFPGWSAALRLLPAPAYNGNRSFPEEFPIRRSFTLSKTSVWTSR